MSVTPDADQSVTPTRRTARQHDDANELAAIHSKIAAHFLHLRERRDALGSNVPVFALEHGLDGAGLAALDAAVRSAFRRQDAPAGAWLPLIVYAAELGYRYCGDEYWQTFEDQTPGWAKNGDRHYIRAVFERFSDTFGGARPSGTWASWFSIISWPITHAVLPADLQRHLARLLFDSCAVLTADLLADPDALGLRLAARAGHYSKRFQDFAQNTKLLGQVAAALLAEDEESPYLLGSTLRRIARSLSAEEQARRWLQDTRRKASQVRMRGFRRPTPSRPGCAISRRPGRPRATDPVVSLRRGQDGWSAWLTLPDLSVLAEQLPGIHDELGQLRPQVAGAAQNLLPGGQLLYPGKSVPLAAWPRGDTPLIQLERGQRSTNELLARECALPPGPPWVFRLREAGLATEVKGKIVHPGGRYILLRHDAVKPACLPQWISTAACRTSGVRAYQANVPPVVDDRHAEEARTLGFAVQADVSIRPAGVVAASWDGEGTAEWLSGEDAILAVRSTRTIGHCIFEMAGIQRVLPWPADRDEIFVTVSGLGVGMHEARVSVLPAGGGDRVATGTFIMTVRDPSPRSPRGTPGEGLALVASPATPPLPAIWDGRASLQILGPPGISAQAQIDLADRHHRIIARQAFMIKIPVDLAGWRHFTATRIRESRLLQQAYDNAESCIITVSGLGLGIAELRCERDFAPLRWTVGARHDDPFARLIDNTDDGTTAISCYPFSAPDQPSTIAPGADGYIRQQAGGLIRARAADFEAAVILPPKIRYLADFQQADVRPRFSRITTTTGEAARSADTACEVVGLAAVARMWATAALPSNPLAQHERRSVLRAVAMQIACLICGRHWANAEQRARGDAPSVRAMQNAIGVADYQRTLARLIADRLDEWTARRPEERVDDLSFLLDQHVRRARLGNERARRTELLLRLASDPATIAAWPSGEVSAAIEQVIVVPVLMRAARFVVLAIHAATEEDGGTTYRGWEWT